MTESTNSLQKLFQAGLTREQFVDRYAELQQKGEKDSSIFKEEMASSIGTIYDTLNTNGDDKLDENEKVLIDSKRNWQYYTTNKNGMLKERSGSYV